MKTKIVVSFSGGKDSHACLIQAAKKYGSANITAVFCDTGWEHPVTYQHIKEVCTLMQVELVTLKSAYNFVSLAKKKGRFPSTKARFCTEELKVKPMIDYILSLNQSCIIIQGIRASESNSRAMMDEECMYFKGYFIENEKGKTFSYRKKEVKEFCSKHDVSVHRPIFRWSSQEVIDYILENNQQPNPLYSRGFSRVGCFPCIMARKQEIRLISKSDVEMKLRLIEAEKEVEINFFPPGYIPKRCCKNGSYPTSQEVFDYVDVGVDDMFAPADGYSCMSLYHGLCE